MSEYLTSPDFVQALIDDLKIAKDEIILEHNTNPSPTPIFDVCSDDQLMVQEISETFNKITLEHVKNYLYNLLCESSLTQPDYYIDINPSPYIDFFVFNGFEQSLVALRPISSLENVNDICKIREEQLKIDPYVCVYVAFLIENTNESQQSIYKVYRKLGLYPDSFFGCCPLFKMYTFEEFLSDEKFWSHTDHVETENLNPIANFYAGKKFDINENFEDSMGVEDLEKFENFQNFKKKITSMDEDNKHIADFIIKTKQQATQRTNEFLNFLTLFKKEASQIVGYRITELCSPENWEKLRINLEEELSTFDFDEVRKIQDNENEKEITDKATAKVEANNKLYSVIKNSFLNNRRYELLLGNLDFAISFKTSEWFYKNYVSDIKMDNTNIVTGYLKCVEQLLWYFIRSQGKGRQLKLNGPAAKAKLKESKNKTECEDKKTGCMTETITDQNLDEFDTTLGALQNFLNSKGNIDLFIEPLAENKDSARLYLYHHIDKWRINVRNDYLHKDILKDPKEVEQVRNQTWFLLLLILGSLKFDSVEETSNSQFHTRSL